MEGGGGLQKVTPIGWRKGGLDKKDVIGGLTPTPATTALRKF